MENLCALLIPLGLLAGMLRLMAMPLRLGWKLLLNSLGGFACLWLLNTLSVFTGLRIPINAVTALVAGFLGLPGLGLLALAQYLL